ncbi:UNKNOWN [Stylonychia lemnae]|uniref:Uncharacterized protein n=1 Tax=Stylonychia lemnae TaxID=5949 RepID=A0A077ZS84_STYLE|nr:UNKNOWN [Stylonychia lemnae]|eukprot:CDW72758.1 UNKNOWN [Stylonychia lemnae]
MPKEKAHFDPNKDKGDLIRKILLHIQKEFRRIIENESKYDQLYSLFEIEQSKGGNINEELDKIANQKLTDSLQRGWHLLGKRKFENRDPNKITENKNNQNKQQSISRGIIHNPESPKRDSTVNYGEIVEAYIVDHNFQKRRIYFKIERPLLLTKEEQIYAREMKFNQNRSISTDSSCSDN